MASIWPGKNLSLPKSVSFVGKLHFGGEVGLREREDGLIPVTSRWQKRSPCLAAVLVLLLPPMLHPFTFILASPSEVRNWDFGWTERRPPIMAAADTAHTRKPVCLDLEFQVVQVSFFLIFKVPYVFSFLI